MNRLRVGWAFSSRGRSPHSWSSRLRRVGSRFLIAGTRGHRYNRESRHRCGRRSSCRGWAAICRPARRRLARPTSPIRRCPIGQPRPVAAGRTPSACARCRSACRGRSSSRVQRPCRSGCGSAMRFNRSPRRRWAPTSSPWSTWAATRAATSVAVPDSATALHLLLW